MLRTAASLLAALALVAVRAPDARACQPVELEAALLTRQVEAAADGGLVMAQVQVERDGSDASALALQAGGQRIAYESIWLAPGLEVWRVKPAAGAAMAAVTVVDGKGATRASIAVVARRDKLKAPSVKAARSSIKRPPGLGRQPGSPMTTARLALARALPADAVALIVYTQQRGEAVPVAWSGVTPGTTAFELHGGGKGCGGGAGSIFAGDRISIAWVDARGRVSPRSAARTVALGR